MNPNVAKLLKQQNEKRAKMPQRVEEPITPAAPLKMEVLHEMLKPNTNKLVYDPTKLKSRTRYAASWQVLGHKNAEKNFQQFGIDLKEQEQIEIIE